MNYQENLPWIISPCSNNNVGGIGSWTRNMHAYAETLKPNNLFYIQTYANNLKLITNTGFFPRILTGLILYIRLSINVYVILLKYKPSLLHVTSSASIGLIKDMLIIWLAKLTKTPVVFHWRFGRIPELARVNNWEWRLLKLVIRYSKSSIVIDEKSYNKLVEKGLTNIVNVPNPISIDIEQRSIIKFEKNAYRFKGRILFVGHIIQNKGVFELVEACVEIPAVKELIIVGPGGENIKNKLISLSKKREDGNWLKLVGQKNKDQVLDYMENSQILVLPSYTEGFPNVVLEAMAMGCPVIATDVGAVTEMIDCGSIKPCGLCVPVRDVEKLKEAIIDLINNPEKADRMGKMGIERTLNHYTIKKVVDQYVKVWNNVSRK